MDVTRVNIEWDEDGCYLELQGDGGARDYVRFHIHDPEQLYDRVKGAIGPWLRERDEARVTYVRHSVTGQVFAWDPDESAGAYELSDPKHPDFHSVHADIWDAREGK